MVGNFVSDIERFLRWIHPGILLLSLIHLGRTDEQVGDSVAVPVSHPRHGNPEPVAVPVTVELEERALCRGGSGQDGEAGD